MYLKNPNPRVQYTFRIKEQTLEDLKEYAKAKDMKLPTLLNGIIDEHLDGMNLRHTWSRDQLNLFITIPKHYPNTIVNLTHSIDIDGWQFEIKQMPVNLDTWNDKYGYISSQKNIKHEGVEPLLIPQFVEDLTLKKDKTTAQYIMRCLIGLYIIEYEDGTTRVDLIDYEQVLKKLALANPDLLKKYKHSRTLLSRIVNDNLANLNRVNHDKVKETILEQLEDLAMKINTGNVVGVVADHNNIFDNVTVQIANENDLNDAIPLEELLDNLKKENAIYKNTFDKLNEEINNINKRQEAWDSLKDTLEKENAFYKNEVQKLTNENKKFKDVYKEMEEIAMRIKYLEQGKKPTFDVSRGKYIDPETGDDMEL